MLTVIVYGLFLGVLTGIFWGVAFDIALETSLLYGGLGGVVIALIISFIGKMAKMGGNLKQGEITFVSFSILTMIGFFAAGSGILVWIASLFLR